MEYEITDDELDRYLSGEAQPDERARVEAWIRSDTSHAAFLRDLRAALDDEARPEFPDVDAAWESVRQRIERDTGMPAPRRPTRDWQPALLRAAVLAALLLGGWGAWRAMRSGPIAPAPVFAAAATAAAQRDTISLPDGSTVILAPSSELSGVALDDTVRAFDLSGEAFFQVAAEADRPFRVRAGDAVTEVLGTEFNVRARPGAAVTVAVREGRVAVSNGTSPGITLDAGQVGRVAGGIAALVEGDTRAWLSWLDGVLEFDGEQLDEVAAELSRWFGREIAVVDPALAARRVTGRFETTSAEQALEALSITLGIPWSASDDGFVLGTTERN